MSERERNIREYLKARPTIDRTGYGMAAFDLRERTGDQSITQREVWEIKQEMKREGE